MASPIAYLDANLPTEERVTDLLSRMTLEEKVGQMCQYLLPSLGFSRQPEAVVDAEAGPAPDSDDSTMRYTPVDQASVPTLIAQGLIGSILSETDPARINAAQKLAEQSRLGVPLLCATDAIHGHAMHAGATVFPAPIGLAASWDRSLIRQVAQATAREMRACNLHWTFSPNVDVLRDGRWGRSGETFGEDPYLVGQLGAAMIAGYQCADDPEAYVMACAKHYIAGGEPLIHPDIVEIVAFIAENGIKPIVLTNAAKLTPGLLCQPRRAGLAGSTLHIDCHQNRPGGRAGMRLSTTNCVNTTLTESPPSKG